MRVIKEVEKEEKCPLLTTEKKPMLFNKCGCQYTQGEQMQVCLCACVRRGIETRIKVIGMMAFFYRHGIILRLLREKGAGQG
jgi:hypothetical protein